MSNHEKTQGRKYVAQLLVEGVPSTWPGVMDRIEKSLSKSGDGEDQKRFSDGFIIGARAAIKCLRARLAKEKEKSQK